ncbi:MAG: alpha/beta hydrolase [Steroidobacteraceae bacterium]
MLPVGPTSSYVCQHDPRFSYWLYVPRQYATAPPAHRLILVAIHGTDRNAPFLRSLFEAFADRTGVLVVAPHFPGGIGDPHDVHAYKYLEGYGVRYDRVLTVMIDDIADRFSANAERFLLFGFSGGAHFVHRFWYLYPERLRAVAVAAPGSVTLPDASRKWWTGLADVGARFGRNVDFQAMARVRAFLVVGQNDTSTDAINRSPDSPYWAPDAHVAGRTRIERLKTLRDALAAKGVVATHLELPGVGHEYRPMVEAAAAFFEREVSELAAGNRRAI